IKYFSISFVSVYLVYFLSLVIQSFYQDSVIIDLINGISQIIIFFSFFAASLYSFVKILNLWQKPFCFQKVFILVIGFIIIVAVFGIDVLYGLWSKLHFHRVLSLFYILPAYTIIVSTLLTVFILRKNRSTEESKRLSISSEFCLQYGITDREKDVISLLLKGKSYQNVADELFISIATVQSHVRNIYRKTDVNNKMELLNLVKST
ncbi:MAG: helix-turn-helix transcriptional regulator, partial [Spirochaetales bacterium]|nr:helix-turn-helix transcriptional regulator [Spirochaetales bacterium]